MSDCYYKGAFSQRLGMFCILIVVVVIELSGNLSNHQFQENEFYRVNNKQIDKQSCNQRMAPDQVHVHTENSP